MAVSEEMQAGRALGDRWRGLRDALLSSRRFQRFAAAFPLTRPIARRRAADLFDLCAGFVYSQVLFACVSLRLLPQLQGGPQSVTTLAARASVPIDAITLCGVSLHQVSPVGDGDCTASIIVAKKFGDCTTSAGRLRLLRNAASAPCVFGPSTPSMGAAS